MRRNARIKTILIITVVLITIGGIGALVRRIQLDTYDAQCRSNLFQLGFLLTLPDASDWSKGKSLPPAYLADENGLPSHSWRTLFVEEVSGGLCSYSFSEPWNSPENCRVATACSWIFLCPHESAAAQTSLTSYVAVVGKNTLWHSRRPRPLDGQGSVIMLIEIPDSNIVWTEPRDITLDEALRLFEAPDGLRSRHGGHEMHFITAGLDVGRISSFPTVDEFAARLMALDGTQPEPVAPTSMTLGTEQHCDAPVSSDTTQPDVATAPFSTQEALNHQQLWATVFGRPVAIVNSLGMRLNLIPPGEFMMGSPDDEPERSSAEGPLHRVRITHPFYMGTTEVAQEEFKFVMGTDASQFSRDGRSSDFVVGVDTKCLPADGVSWSDAVEFCERLSSLPAEFSAGRIYRLPSEAEWEYACRAGTISRYHFGNSLNGTEANCNGRLPYGTPTKGPYLNRTAAVGSYSPNAYGLFDMHGNVWEWCADWYDSAYYRNSPVKDPFGPPSARYHVCRGGDWASFPANCRSAFRNTRVRSNRSSLSGFRIVADVCRQSVAHAHPECLEEKWGVDHFWQQGALNAQSRTLKIPLDGSPTSDYYVSP